jgi:hypothetical protein
MAYRDSTTGRDFFAASLMTPLNDWFNRLQANNYEILPLQRIAVGGLQYFRIKKVDGSAGNGTSVLTCDAAPPLQRGNRVILSQFPKKDLPALNGHYQVLDVNGVLVTINYQTPEQQIIEPNTGRMRQELYQSRATINAASCGPQYIASRKTKLANFGVRGAKSAARIRALD